MLWQRAYRTKIWDQDRKAVGRGPTPEAAQEAAERVWVAEGQRAHEANRDPGRRTLRLAGTCDRPISYQRHRFIPALGVSNSETNWSSDGGIEVSVP